MVVQYGWTGTRMSTSVGHSVDAFNIACITIDANIHQLLQYYLHICHPTIWYPQPSNLLLATNDLQHDAHFIIRSCLEDKMKMYSMLSNTASQLQCIEDFDTPLRLCFLMHKAILATQRRFSEHLYVDGSMLLWLFHLSCAEWYQGNYEAAHAHL